MNTASASPQHHLEVRPVGIDDFDLVLPLLRRFPTSRMTREDWRYTLFGYPWSDTPTRGHALFADGEPVGFMGTIFSERTLAGRLERCCNPSSWIVLEPYRYAALLLLRPLARLQDHTMVFLTPSEAAYGMFVKQGALSLEEEQIVFPPLAGPGQASRAARGSFVHAPARVREGLSDSERRIFDDHAGSPVARHVLLRRDGRSCWLVATAARKRGVPYAEIQHIGDREFFGEHRLLAQAALARVMGIPGLAMAVDRRFLVRRPPPLALRWKMSRLFRPTRSEIEPAMIDGLYSELMGLRF